MEIDDIFGYDKLAGESEDRINPLKRISIAGLPSFARHTFRFEMALLYELRD